jgi:catechol 2,3-dioxygenase-like lactoylglutathione lyase family enzyme
MKQAIVHMSLLVADYDEAIAFFCKTLNFDLLEDTYQVDQDKRWVVVRPPGSTGAGLVLARASNSRQAEFIGNQSGNRVFLFLATDDFHRDHDRMRQNGVNFVREPKTMDYGTVAVFEDLYGNLWDLIEFAEGHSFRI